MLTTDLAQCNPTVFLVAGFALIESRKSQGIAKDFRGKIKANTVFLQISGCFLRIPFKSVKHSLSLATYTADYLLGLMFDNHIF